MESPAKGIDPTWQRISRAEKGKGSEAKMLFVSSQIAWAASHSGEIGIRKIWIKAKKGERESSKVMDSIDRGIED